MAGERPRDQIREGGEAEEAEGEKDRGREATHITSTARERQPSRGGNEGRLKDPKKKKRLFSIDLPFDRSNDREKWIVSNFVRIGCGKLVEGVEKDVFTVFGHRAKRRKDGDRFGTGLLCGAISWPS